MPLQKLMAFCKSKIPLYWFAFPALTITLLLCFNTVMQAQECPANIDFETGTFSGWTCYTGYVASVNDQNIISLGSSGGPVYNRHTMYTSNSGNVLDPYGNFPVNCPNGSRHSIRLGTQGTLS